MRKIAYLTIVVLLLSSCYREVVHDVAWWKAHMDELNTELKKCENNPGDLNNDPNCVNAEDAMGSLMLNPNNTYVPKIS